MGAGRYFNRYPVDPLASFPSCAAPRAVPVRFPYADMAAGAAHTAAEVAGATVAEAEAAGSAKAAALDVLRGRLPSSPASPPGIAEEDAELSDSVAEEEVYRAGSLAQPVPTDGARDVAVAGVAAQAVPTAPVRGGVHAPLRARRAGGEVVVPSAAGSGAVVPLATAGAGGQVAASRPPLPVAVAALATGETLVPPEASDAAVMVDGSAEVAPLAAPSAGRGVPAADAADAADGSAAPSLSAGEELVSLVARLILFPGPAVVSKTLAIPVLAVAYFISHMGFLSGLPPEQASGIIHKTLVGMFMPSSVAGWRTLCRMFGVSDRALYLSGRRAPQTHLAGQPATVSSSLNEHLNPKKESQWVSRRLCLRTSLSLYPDNENTSGPGSLTAMELQKVRELLSTPVGRGLALGARCVVLPAADSDSETLAPTRLRFDWGHAWVALSPPWRVVQALGPALLKPPHSDLSTVHLFPVDEPEPSPHPTTPTGRTPSSGRTVRRKRAASAPSRPPRQPRSSASVAEAEAPELVSTVVPALPTVNHLCVSGEVLPSSVWPQGAWAMQLNLSAALDLSATGNVQLGVTVDFETPIADENGQYSYRVVVSQLETVATAMSKELGPCVTAAAGLDPGCRSVDFLNAVRGMYAQQVVKDATRAADGSQPSSQDDAMDTRDEDLVASDGVRLHVCCAPPPPLERFSFRFSFASRLRLHTEIVHLHRTPGRLWMLIAAKQKVPRMQNIA